MENDDNSKQLTIIPDKGRGLQVSGGQILLPVQERVEPGCPEFYELVRRAFPKDLGTEVVDSLQSQERQHTRAAKICLALVIILVAGVIYYCWPSPAPLQDSTDTVVIATQTRLAVAPLYAETLKQCQANYEQGEYVRCQERLAPLMDDILQNSDTLHDNGRLVFMFLDCCLRNYAKPYVSQALEVANAARKLEPDSLEWPLFVLNFEWHPYLDSYQNYSKLTSHYAAPWCLNKFQKLHREAVDIEQRNRNKPKDRRLDPATFKSLRLTRCQILTSLWLLHGQPLNYPDDYGDAGVEYRETAYKLAKVYADDMAFLNLRLFLAEKVLAGLMPYLPHQYRFDGKDHWDRGYLQGVIDDINSRKDEVQEVKP